MKKILLDIIVAALSLVFITSCTTDIMDILMPSTHTCHLQLNGGFSNYEGEQTTRAAVSVPDGAVMFLLFPNNVTGKATYTNGSWTLAYEGTITEGPCSAYYIPEVENETSTIVNLKKNVHIYGTSEGVCAVATNGDIIVNAQLKPICPRVRFRGDANTTVICKDSYRPYISYTISTGKLESNSENISTISINTSGYSDYYYYTSMPSEMNITIDGTNYSAAIPFPTTPKSVCLNLPTKSNLNGWTKEEGGNESSNMHNGHEYVDLGLPSGLKWATCNVGASKPEKYGKYYAWGETSAYGEAPNAYPADYAKTLNSTYTGQSTKTVYDYAHYKYMTNGSSSWTDYSKYTFADNQKDGCWYSGDTFIGDNKTVLDLEDDAAHVNWGGDWRMPTKPEQDELRTKCTWTWGSQNGVNGYTVVGHNGNSLFLPAAGYRDDSDLYDAGSLGYYWSSSLSPYYSRRAFGLYFDSGRNWYYGNRLFGFSVRAVCP